VLLLFRRHPNDPERHNFFEPRPPRQTRDEVRHQLGVTDEVVVLHSSNLRPVKSLRIIHPLCST